MKRFHLIITKFQAKPHCKPMTKMSKKYPMTTPFKTLQNNRGYLPLLLQLQELEVLLSTAFGRQFLLKKTSTAVLDDNHSQTEEPHLL